MKEERKVVLMITQATVSVSIGLATFMLWGDNPGVLVATFVAWATFWLCVIWNEHGKT